MEERRREEQEEEARRGETRGGSARRARRAGAHGARSLRSAPPPPARWPSARSLASPRAPGCAGGATGRRVGLGLPRPPRPALPRRAPRAWARFPSAAPPAPRPPPARPAAPRRTGRPGGRWLPQRPPGLLGSSLLGAVREGAGPARREGAFKATHTPPSAERRAREPRGLATRVTGKRPALARLEAGSPGRTPVDLGARKGSGLGAYSIPSYLSISPHCPFPHCGAPRASLLAKFPASRPSPFPHHTSNYSQTLP